MDEPENNTAWRDQAGDTWVRSDESAQRLMAQRGGLPDFRWWQLCDGPQWDGPMRGRLGAASPWATVEMYGPLEPGDSDKVQQVIDALAAEFE